MFSKMKDLLEQYSKFVSVLLVSLSIGFGIWLGYVHSNSDNLEDQQEETKKTKLLQEKAEFSVQELSSGVLLISGMDHIVLTHDYIFAQDLEYELEGDIYITKQNVVKIYRTETPSELYKEYDLLKLSQSQSMGINPRKILENLYVYKWNQQIHLAFDYVDVNQTKTNTDLEAGFVNIESGQWLTDFGSFMKKDSSIILGSHAVNEKLSRYGLVLTASENGYVALEADFDKEPKLKDLKISQTYPQLEKELKDGKSFVLLGEQAYADMVKLLAKEGEEDLYTGLKLSAQDSKDDQEHVVGSYQEFLNWYKVD